MHLKRRLVAALTATALISTMGGGLAWAQEAEPPDSLESVTEAPLREAPENPVVTPSTDSGSGPTSGSTPTEVIQDETEDVEVAAVEPSKAIGAQTLCKSSADGLITRSGVTVTVNLDKARVNKLIISAPPYGEEDCLEQLQVLTFTNSANSSTKKLTIEERALIAGTWTSATFPSNMDEVAIMKEAFYQGPKTTLQSVTFGSNVKMTHIGWRAFAQYANGGLSNRLTTVTFGKNAAKLTIEPFAFAQEVSGSGENALRTLTFGAGVRDLTIGRDAFFQEADGNGDNPLSKVYFPDGIQNLTIGNAAFAQNYSYGDASSKSALEEISIPGGMSTLEIDGIAFKKGRGAAQPRIVFRTNKPPTSGINTITIGDGIVGYDQYWYWDGADDVVVAKAWETQIKSIGYTSSYGTQYKLRGPATIKPGSVSISGSAQVGSTLTANPGKWTPAGVKLSYQWLLDGKTISGATGTTYKPLASQVGKKITVQVTGSLAGAKSVAQTSSAVVVKAAPKPAPKPGRLAGVNRYETNYQVNLKDMKAGKPLFVATGTQFPDALSIGPAVALTDGALVLAPRGGFKPGDNSLNLIKQRKPSAVYIIGGPNAVSNAIANQVGSAAGRTPERIGGSNRYETSDQVFRKFFSNRSVSAAFVATGANYPDALSAAAAGGTLGMPVLLVPGTSSKGQLQASSVSLLKSKGVKSLVVVGGSDVVTNQVANNAARQVGASVTRKSGYDRYGTNLAINEYVNSKQGGVSSITGLWIATGRNFPDALSAGGPAGKAGQRLVLSNGACIPKPVVSTWIKGPGSNVKSIQLVGDSGVLKASVEKLTQCN